MRARDFDRAERLASELVEIDRRPCRILLRADVRVGRDGSQSDDALDDLDELDEAIEDLDPIVDECDEPRICERAEALLAEIGANTDSADDGA